MANINAAKIKALEEIKELFKDAKAITITDYRGLTVDKVNQLRGQLREAGTRFKVVKNTLSRMVLKEAGVDEEFIKLFVGPVAVAVDYEDITAGIKVLSKFVAEKTNNALEIKGGYIEGRVCSTEELDTLSKLLSKEELRAQLLSLLQTPARNFVSLFNAPARNILGVLSNYAESKA